MDLIVVVAGINTRVVLASWLLYYVAEGGTRAGRSSGVKEGQSERH
jgi:hypothetical protein